MASHAIAQSNTVSNTTSFAFDRFDRFSTTMYPNASTEVPTYDADGNVRTRLTRRGDTIAFAYDPLNRVCTKTYATTATACGGTSSSYLVDYAYDLAGRLIAANDNSSSIATPTVSSGPMLGMVSTTYDQMNRPLVFTIDSVPAQTTPTASTTNFAYAYDATNRRIAQAASDNSWWSYPTTADATFAGKGRKIRDRASSRAMGKA
jgi:YD repeat-containing protein